MFCTASPIPVKAALNLLGHNVGGLRLPGDETGDCQMFTERLASHAAARGVTFKFDTAIDRIVAEGDKITGIATSAGLLTADAYIVALGSFSPIMVRPLGLSLPVYPIKGYSITVPIVDANRAPVSTLLDESYKVAITRLGDRIRVAGQAEIIGYNAKLGKGATDTVRYVVSDSSRRAGTSAGPRDGPASGR